MTSIEELKEKYNAIEDLLTMARFETEDKILRELRREL